MNGLLALPRKLDIEIRRAAAKKPDDFRRVFEAFYTTKSNGVGMGLLICRSIISAQGGRLWAETKKPRGAVFLFTLPAVQVGA